MKYPRALCLALCALSGCQRQSAPPSVTGAPAASTPQAERTIEFADRIWTYVGPTFDWGDARRISMGAHLYTCDDPGLRLIEHLPREGGREGVYSRLLHVQALIGDRWVSHGPEANWTLLGTRGESYNSLGKTNGTRREWHANGVLWIERELVNDMEHGRVREWYDNGQLMYDAKYVFGEEIEIHSWDENGNQLE
jgi:hypothetical protein